MSFRQAYEATLLTIVTTRDLLSVAVLSVVLYAFYYPAPYSHQAAQALPIVVVDGDRGVLARRLIEHLGDTRAIQLVGEVPGMAAARAAVRERRAEGILLLSNDFAREAAAGRAGAGVGIWLNGSYLLRAESIASALAETIEDALAERQAALGTARGRSPPILVHPLFNTTGGYRDYIFPAVANIILQQTLLFAGARLVAERRRRGLRASGLAESLGRWAACTTIGMLAAGFYFGFVFWVQDIPRAGNLPALAVAVPLFAGAVAALGLAAGSFFRNGDDALKVLLPTSVPLVFLAGFAWPHAAMPGWLAALSWLSPATAAMHLFTRLNQMGATLSEVAGPLIVLALSIAVYLPVYLWRSRIGTVAPDTRWPVAR